MVNGIQVTGSMVQAYTVCPDEDNVYLALGRLVDQQSYGREIISEKDFQYQSRH
ncbi:MAG TPA: hypothetical protein PLW51_06800 [Bacillota bacterium]|nr:hypothetical protein [Bacillota bacterium]HOB28121.1 hypothetical protein [Bacillota bacterium]HPZ40728.1 hypothetical protein [Bacillota bacterium]HQD52875.1 hypothetical protein [Bacillota bacterium]